MHVTEQTEKKLRHVVDVILICGCLFMLLWALGQGLEAFQRDRPVDSTGASAWVMPPEPAPTAEGRPTGQWISTRGVITHFPPEGVFYVNDRGTGAVLAAIRTDKWPVRVEVRPAAGPTWEVRIDADGRLAVEKLGE